MDRILKVFFFLFVCLLPIKVFAIGSIKVNTTDITILKGETCTFKINLDNAVGRIDVTSNDDKVASISDKSFFLDMESKLVTVNGIAPGNTIINIVASDVSTYDSEDLSNKIYKINVLVKDYIKGDVNQNDKIDLTDITIVLKKYLSNDINKDELKLMDMNDNGKLDLYDITALLKIYLYD